MEEIKKIKLEEREHEKVEMPLGIAFLIFLAPRDPTYCAKSRNLSAECSFTGLKMLTKSMIQEMEQVVLEKNVFENQ